jgi:hypothetical protein
MQTDRQIDFTVIVTLKAFHGVFGSTSERFDFRFCAASLLEAIELASSNVNSKGFPFDEKSVEVTDALPAGNPIPSDECFYGDHDECNFRWCECVCHKRIQFPLESAPLRSGFEIQSEREEGLA